MNKCYCSKRLIVVRRWCNMFFTESAATTTVCLYSVLWCLLFACDVQDAELYSISQWDLVNKRVWYWPIHISMFLFISRQ